MYIHRNSIIINYNWIFISKTNLFLCLVAMSIFKEMNQIFYAEVLLNNLIGGNVILIIFIQ